MALPLSPSSASSASAASSPLYIIPPLFERAVSDSEEELRGITGKTASIAQNSLDQIVPNAPSTPLNFSPGSRSRSKSPKIEDIVRQRNLLNQSRSLSSRSGPLTPFDLNSINENDVFMEDQIVFKPGIIPMVMGVIGYGIGCLIGADKAVVAGKRSCNSIVTRRDFKADYKIFTDQSGKKYLIDQRTMFILTSDFYPIPGSETIKKCFLASGEIYLEQVDDNLYHFLPPLEAMTKINNIFVVLGKTDTCADTILAPKNLIFPVLEAKGQEAIIIHGIPYRIEENKETSFYSLTPLSDKKPLDPLLISKKFVLLYREDEDEVEEVLVPMDARYSYVENEEEESDSETIPLYLTDFGKDFKATPNEDQTYSLSLIDYIPPLPIVEGELEDSDEEERKESDVQPIKTTNDPLFEAFLIFKEEPFRLIIDKDNHFLVPSDEMQQLQNDEEGEFVVRKTSSEFNREIVDQEVVYRVSTPSSQIQLVNQKVLGLLQEKVQFLFTGFSKDIPLNLSESSSEEKTRFYDRIDVNSFIEVFLLTILLRPQDGKVQDLSQSNYLFQALPNEEDVVDPLNPTCKLRPVMIDLDETMPSSNAWSERPGITDNLKEEVHSVRNGLLAFPQARMALSEAQQAYAVTFLENIVSNKEVLVEYLKNFVRNEKNGAFTSDNLKAFEEIVIKLDQFNQSHKNQAWTMEELFFNLFPEYEQHWRELDKIKMPVENKANLVGFISTSAIRNLVDKP